MKLTFRDASVTRAIVHYVGDALLEEGCSLSEQELDMQESALPDILLHLFSKPFRSNEPFRFFDKSKIVATSIQMILDNPDELARCSVELAKHYYESATGQEKGEFYIVYLYDIEIDGAKYNAVGVFKTAGYQTFLKPSYEKEWNISLDPDHGIPLVGIKCGALITTLAGQLEPSVFIYSSGKEEIWTSYLGVELAFSEMAATSEFVASCREVADVIEQKEGIQGKVKFMNQTFEHLATHGNVDIEEFREEYVPASAKSEFDSIIEERMADVFGKDISGFEVDSDSLKKQQKAAKETIKLDSYMDLKIDYSKGLIDQAEYIETGFDTERGLSFLKVYYHSDRR